MTNIPIIIMLAVLCLVGIGFYALLATRNLIKVIIALQILVKGGLLALVLAGRIQGQVMVGQSMALTAIVADTIVAVVGLALAVQVRKHHGTIDLKQLTKLKR
ncbi:MAG: NADH-quinone oxidoreductase subunit K [Anaerolineaceae bacterium]|jgi:multisubunit Na+/H+ antiporter MnhC subunit